MQETPLCRSDVRKVIFFAPTPSIPQNMQIIYISLFKLTDLPASRRDQGQQLPLHHKLEGARVRAGCQGEKIIKILPFSHIYLKTFFYFLKNFKNPDREVLPPRDRVRADGGAAVLGLRHQVSLSFTLVWFGLLRGSCQGSEV